MRPPAFKTRNGVGGTIFWDLLTFEKLMTNQVIHLIYWAGLGVIALVAFGMVGAAVGVALREESWIGVILAIPVLVAGVLVVAALVLLWRSFCELYVALFRLSDDLHAIRQATDADQARGTTPRP
ncbi:DUF4282 domain-containing protein [Phenylobacterium sp. LH3H17]|uniref:DUF4282 domain-containing protein n=1 Tax=Phenylobacterium sp. LH3H17 TaxID=2903901 RepID=UPI0020C979B3|nr:DUF4282 domain-containing protein [Phenylobacterium sp. LH3H17]UTP40688.1 DUF4282 domain-containing protein [Phenylobacterium sp. LH3H17]